MRAAARGFCGHAHRCQPPWEWPGPETDITLVVDLASVKLRCGCCDQLFLVLSKHIERLADVLGDLPQEHVADEGSDLLPVVFDFERDVLLVGNVCGTGWRYESRHFLIFHAGGRPGRRWSPVGPRQASRLCQHPAEAPK
jgi:hypothetical protein